MIINYGHACSKSLLLDAGDSLNSSLVAIVAVEPEVLKAWAASEGIQVKVLNCNDCHLFISSFKKMSVSSLTLIQLRIMKTGVHFPSYALVESYIE